MRTKALARVAGAAMVEMLERKRLLCHFLGLSKGQPCSQSPFLIANSTTYAAAPSGSITNRK